MSGVLRVFLLLLRARTIICTRSHLTKPGVTVAPPNEKSGASVAVIINIRSSPNYVKKARFAFRLPDGTVVAGDTAAEVVQAMSAEKMTTPKSRRSYRLAVARRINGFMPDVQIKTENDTDFVKSLVRMGQLVDLKKGDSANA